MNLLPRRADVTDAARIAQLEAEIAASHRRIAALNAELASVRAHRARIENERLALIRAAEDAARAAAPGAHSPLWAPEPDTQEVPS